MAIFEYSKWDGSQEFLPQSADKVFDQLSEYLIQYGDRSLAEPGRSRRRDLPRSSS